MASLPAVSENSLFQQDKNVPPAALLQHLSASPRLARVTPASRLELCPTPETTACGIAPLDTLMGGLPRGCLTEITGPSSSGRTSVLLAALAAATRRGEICALIDACDAFHPHSGAAAGIDLARLLWVRCTPKSPVWGKDISSAESRAEDFFARRNSRRPNSAGNSRAHSRTAEELQRRRMEDPVEQALRAADLLLQSGGFGMVAIDLAGVPVKLARRIPLTTWFRFRRVVEHTPTVLLVIGEQSCAQTCATLCLQLAGQDGSRVAGRWSLGKKPSAFSYQLSAVSSQRSVLGSQRSSCDSQASDFDVQLSIFNPNKISLSSCSVPAEGGSDPVAQSSRLEARSSPLEAAISPSHARLLEGLSIRIKLLRSRLEHKPAQSTTTFLSHPADFISRDEACPVSASSATRSHPVSSDATNPINAFHLRAHQLRAHG